MCTQGDNEITTTKQKEPNFICIWYHTVHDCIFPPPTTVEDDVESYTVKEEQEVEHVIDGCKHILLNEKDDEILMLKSRIKNKDLEIKTLKLQVKTLKNDMKQMSNTHLSELNKLNAHIIQLDQEGKKKDGEISQLDVKVQALENNIIQLSTTHGAEVSKLEKIINKINQEVKKLNERIDKSVISIDDDEK